MLSVLGWASSTVLVLTITTQVKHQWDAGSSEGVSPLLFVGQFIASTGLVIYSALGQQWVFLVLNVFMSMAAVVGAVIWWKNREVSA